MFMQLKQPEVDSLIQMLDLKIHQKVLDYLINYLDLMFVLISTEELEELNQICVKQLKNRYYDPTMNKRFIIGIDRSKMKLFDVELKTTR